MTWLNRPSGNQRDELFAEQGPKDAFGLVGHLGQYVIVVPSKGLTIVRLGKSDGPQRPALVKALGEIVALYPSR
jgi:CubicO group peptidase (beta-lactamase class C family)